MNYQERIVRCTARTAERQLACELREAIGDDCSDGKCRAAAEKGFISTLGLVMGGSKDCDWCRSMRSYCKYRNEEGECEHD